MQSCKLFDFKSPVDVRGSSEHISKAFDQNLNHM